MEGEDSQEEEVKKLDVRVNSDCVLLKEAWLAYRRGGPDLHVRAYKFVNSDLMSPWASWDSWRDGILFRYERIDAVPIKYTLGTEPTVLCADANSGETCGKGVNVAPLQWCTNSDEWPHITRFKPRYVAVEFKLSDIATIPRHVCKFRLYRCKVVHEVDATGKAIAWIRGGKINRRHE